MQDEVMIDIDNPKNDYISRQAVLDCQHMIYDETGEELEVILAENVLNLPSVTLPEPKTDTWSIKDVANALERHGFGRLAQEPCEDEYIKVPKKALKYRTAGMVAYNTEWLKNHFDMERALICGAQEPNTDGDVISRDMALEKMADYVASGYADSAEDFEEYSKIICQLPSVTPQEKTGHWIPVYQGDEIIDYRCSECEFGNTFGKNTDGMYFCPRCGARMSEVE